MKQPKMSRADRHAEAQALIANNDVDLENTMSDIQKVCSPSGSDCSVQTSCCRFELSRMHTGRDEEARKVNEPCIHFI